jgi:hypothetical protein
MEGRMMGYCRKCKGLMVAEWLCDALEDAYVSKCLNCGAVTDPLIEANRRAAGQSQTMNVHMQP